MSATATEPTSRIGENPEEHTADEIAGLAPERHTAIVEALELSKPESSKAINERNMATEPVAAA